MKATFLSQIVSTDYRTRLVVNEPEVASYMEISDDAYRSYIDGMRLCAREGTAMSIFETYPIDVCAKTGTAQHDIRGASDHGAFMCFAPATNPSIAIYVYGEKSGSGSAMGPVAKAILDIHFEVGEIGDVVTYENRVS
jgi:penicillin-binding protein 2